MPDTKELRECPFCGGGACVVKIEHPPLTRPSRNKLYSIFCNNCDLQFGYDVDYGGQFDTDDEAIAAWNTRNAMPGLLDEVERLRAYKKGIEEGIGGKPPEGV